MIQIDGSIGGGQILRTSLSLSTLTQKSFRMINIRGKREKSGLQHQHLTAVNSIAEICNAKVKGDVPHSHELEFIPSEVISGNYKFDIGTAGSTTLVLQTLLPPLIFTDHESTVEIIGGTANPLAPPALDVREVFLKVLKNLGINVNLEIIREGFYPKGNGKIKATIYPCKQLNEFEFNNIESKEINLFAVASKELKEREVAKRLIKGFKLNFHMEYKITGHESYVDTLSPGCYIHANLSNQIGTSILGEKSKKAEDIGKECAVKLLEEINSQANADHFTCDQLLLYMAIKGSGKMKVSQITDHMKTNISVIEKFLDVKFKIKNNIIECYEL